MKRTWIWWKTFDASRTEMPPPWCCLLTIELPLKNVAGSCWHPEHLRHQSRRVEGGSNGRLALLKFEATPLLIPGAGLHARKGARGAVDDQSWKFSFKLIAFFSSKQDRCFWCTEEDVAIFMSQDSRCPLFAMCTSVCSIGLQMYTHYGVPVIEAMATKGAFSSARASRQTRYSYGRGRAKEVIQLRRVGQLERVLWRLENCERAWSARANRCFASTQRAECRNGQSHYSHYSPCQLNGVGIEPNPEISISVFPTFVTGRDQNKLLGGWSKESYAGAQLQNHWCLKELEVSYVVI